MTSVLGPTRRSWVRRTPGALACAAMLLACQARADEVAELIKSVRAATGAAHMSEHPGGVMLKGHAVFLEQDATYSLIFDGSGRFVQEISAQVGVIQAYDGKTAWVRDLGGETRVQELGERTELLMASAILTGSWLREGVLTLTMDKTQTDPAFKRLSFAFDEGRLTGHVDIDSATSLPRQWVLASGGDSQTIDIGGWTDFRGLKVPRSTTRTTDHGLKIATTIDSVADAPSFIRSPYEPVLGAATDVRFDRAVSGALEVRKAPTGHLLVRPSLDGKEQGWFIFDTGAGSSVLNNATAEKLGLKRLGSVPATGVGGSKPAGLYRSTTLTLGPVTIDNPLFIGLDLTFLDQYMGVEVAGIVGYGLLARSVVELDAVGGTVALHDPASYKLKGAEWNKLIVYERVPCAEASFEGHSGYFKLDSGAGNSTVTIHAPTVEKFKLLDGRQTTPAVLGGVGGTVPAAAGRLEWFEIGGHHEKDIGVTFATKRSGAFGDEYTLGNIGGQLLSPFTLVLDYQNSRIGFVPKGKDGAAPAATGAK